MRYISSYRHNQHRCDYDEQSRRSPDMGKSFVASVTAQSSGEETGRQPRAAQGADIKNLTRIERFLDSAPF